MHVTHVLIDCLDPTGCVTSIHVLPQTKPVDDASRLIVDRLADIGKSTFADEGVDLGGVRVYDAPSCRVELLRSRLRNFRVDWDSWVLTYTLSHHDLPVGSEDQACAGIYNLILPPGWRLRRQRVEPEESVVKPRVYWDSACNTQLVELRMTSRRGAFTFEAAGEASLVHADAPDTKYVPAWVGRNLAHTIDYSFLGRRGRRLVGEEMGRASEWIQRVELKPNLFGVGLNGNRILEDILNFKRRMRE